MNFFAASFCLFVFAIELFNSLLLFILGSGFLVFGLVWVFFTEQELQHCTSYMQCFSLIYNIFLINSFVWDFWFVSTWTLLVVTESELTLA